MLYSLYIVHVIHDNDYHVSRVQYIELWNRIRRSVVLADKLDFAGYQSIIRLAGFCWTGTGFYREGKYKATELAG